MESISKEVLYFINGSVLTITTLIAFIFKRNVKDIDQSKKDIEELYEKKVDDKIFNATLNRLDNTIEIMRKENRDDFNRLHDKIDGVGK